MEKEKTQCSSGEESLCPPQPCARSYDRHGQGQKGAETAGWWSSGRANGRGQYPRTECLANVHSSLHVPYDALLLENILSSAQRNIEMDARKVKDSPQLRNNHGEEDSRLWVCFLSQMRLFSWQCGGRSIFLLLPHS